MANPALIDCPEGQWTKVATDVTSGVIHTISDAPAKYTQTYRATGDAAPTTIAEAVPFKDELIISASVGIDVYVWPQGAAGKIRAGL